MKKSLIALAILGTGVGVASAQSTVTIYGSIDTGIEKVAGSSSRVSSGASKSNRIGFRGVEDLGGGLKASFVVETGLKSDTGGFQTHSGFAGLGNRATWLSLGSKDLGTVSLGRGYAGVFYVQSAVDPTGHKFGSNVDGTGSLQATNVNSRYDNTIRYESPSLYGFKLDLAGGLQGDAQSDTTRPTVDAGSATTAGSATRNIAGTSKGGYNLGLTYNQGPIYVGVGTASTPGRSATGLAANSARSDKNTTILAASYDLGFVKLGGSFENDNRYSSRENSWMLSASAPLGVGRVLAFYGEDRNGGATLSDSLKIAQIAYQYSLSKRTNLYAGFTNNNVSGRNAGGVKAANSYTSVIDGTVTQVGLSHSF
ncbi:MAG: porin [Burkholderiales bacterium]|nr:porin [Burkholderiales bacterium]